MCHLSLDGPVCGCEDNSSNLRCFSLFTHQIDACELSLYLTYFLASFMIMRVQFDLFEIIVELREKACDYLYKWTVFTIV